MCKWCWLSSHSVLHSVVLEQVDAALQERHVVLEKGIQWMLQASHLQVTWAQASDPQTSGLVLVFHAVTPELQVPSPRSLPSVSTTTPGLLPLQPRQSHWCGWTYTWYERSKALERPDKKLLKTVVGEIINDKYSHRTWDMFYKVLTLKEFT